MIVQRRPIWTVLYYVPQNFPQTRTERIYEFTYDEESAQALYDRHLQAGNVPTMRRFYAGIDGKGFDALHLPDFYRRERLRELQ